MTRGRKPLPTHIKLVKGTTRVDRLNPNELKPPLVIPAPPTHLDDQEKAKFVALAEMLVCHGLLTELDVGAVARYAVVWRRWLKAEAEIKQSGHMIETTNGNLTINPHLLVSNRCMAQMSQIESEFGLTPSARSRIRMEKPNDTIDPFDEYLSRGKQLDLWRPEKS